MRHRAHRTYRLPGETEREAEREAERAARATGLTSGLTLGTLTPSFERTLLAANKSPHTILNYLTGVRLLDQYLAEQGMPRTVTAIRREHLEAFIADQLARFAVNTAAVRYRALRVFFGWCEEEGEIREHPMRHMREPKAPLTPPDVLTPDEVRALLRTCEPSAGAKTGAKQRPDAARRFTDRRDAAIIRLLIDTGMRAGELVGIQLADVDWSRNTVRVLGKGRRERLCPFGRKTAQALDRYLRERARHRLADHPELWLPAPRAGTHQQLRVPGLRHMLQRRAEAAGIGHVWVHLFRHSFADMWLEGGGQEGALMTLGGWRSHEVMRRYTLAREVERARNAHRALSPGDRL